MLDVLPQWLQVTLATVTLITAAQIVLRFMGRNIGILPGGSATGGSGHVPGLPRRNHSHCGLDVEQLRATLRAFDNTMREIAASQKESADREGRLLAALDRLGNRMDHLGDQLHEHDTTLRIILERTDKAHH